MSERSLPSSISSAFPRPSTNYFERLEESTSKLAALPDELSSERSPISEANVKFIQDRVAEALRHAKHDTSSPKWTHVSRSLRTMCASRRYVGVGKGVIMGQRQEVLGGDYQWVLPESPQGWEECEGKWEKRSLNPPSGEGRASKFFAKNAPPVADGAGTLHSSKAEQVRDKVKQWQAQVVSVSANNTAEKSGAAPSAAAAANGKKRDGEKRQSPLNFPAAKHNAAVASSSKSHSNHDALITKAAAVVPVLQALGPPNEEPRPSTPISTPDVEVIQITDVSEMSFLPPSFPTHLVTSTPPPLVGRSKPREKPPPIPHASSSFPPPSPPLPKSPLERIKVPLEPTSSMPNITSSPPRQLAKRMRPITPPSDKDTSSPSRLPAPKTARTTQAAERISSNPLPPSSTPPPSDSPPETPPPIPIGKGLGNAKGLPIPVTPLRPNVPTLTDLLASSRRSKPRPRPPSRKSKSRGPTPAPSAVHKDMLPVLEEAREASPAPSAPRTIFSSPASGSSSSSPHSERSRPRPSASPLFTQNTMVFAPPFASTQPGAADGPEAAFLPGRTGVGYVGMGYSSQFDVEGQVGMVSDLLERDVDFDGWLRDMPEVDAEL